MSNKTEKIEEVNMKGKMKLAFGLIAVCCVICGLVAVAYIMGNVGKGSVEVVNTHKAILCTVLAIAAGGVTLLKRHGLKQKR